MTLIYRSYFAASYSTRIWLKMWFNYLKPEQVYKQVTTKVYAIFIHKIQYIAIGTGCRQISVTKKINKLYHIVTIPFNPLQTRNNRYLYNIIMWL